MSTSASRRVRSARNALVEALGLGETFPLRDLPVTGEPPVVPYGQTAIVTVEDSERSVHYRLFDQAGQQLPDGAAPEGPGNGMSLAIETPAITENVTFTLHATRPNGRDALLVARASIKVGLDATLPVTAASQGGPPIVIDHRATLEIVVTASQEGVTYRLVRRPSPDPAAPDDFAAVASDIPLSDPDGVSGTGAPIRILTLPLVEDTPIRVRAIKAFDGGVAQPSRTTLLTTTVEVFVRADSSLVVSGDPAILEHAAATAIRIATSQPGVAYRLHARAVADADFSRSEPLDPATLAVPTPDGDVRIVPPPPSSIWQPPPGFAPVGDAASGNGGTLALPLPALTADTLVLVEARKAHADDAFTTAERLDQAVAVLVRPDPRPHLRLEAGLTGDGLVRLCALAGQPGVFYALSAGAPLGELYLHQRDPSDATLNKGIGALAVSVDLVVAADGDLRQPTSAAPPPVPLVEVTPLPLPCDLAVAARRAMTGLTAPLGSATIAPLPGVEVQPQAIAPGGSARIGIAAPAAGDRYTLLVDGQRVADPVRGGAGPLSLDTGPLAAGARVELWASAAAEDAAIVVERRMPLAVTVG